MEQKHSALKTAFPISAAWFGALVGPSMVSGIYAYVYFAPYGAWGIPLSFIAIAPAAAILALAMNIVRRNQTYNYSDFAQVVYGKAYKFLMPVYDFYIILSMVLGGGSVIAMGGTFFEQILHVPTLVGAILMAVLSIIICIYGAGMIRKTSSAMTVILIICFLTMMFAIIKTSGPQINEIMDTWYVPEGANLGKAFYKAFLIGFSNFGFGSGMCAIEQNVRTKKDCGAFWIISTILNGGVWALTTIMILPYFAECVGAGTSVPTLYVMQNYLQGNFGVIYTFYMIAMFLALLSSGAPQLYAITPRILKIVNKRRDASKANEKRDNLIVGVCYFAFTIICSRAGLIAIVSKGYTFGGQLGFCLLAIPTLIYTFRHLGEKGKPFPEDNAIEEKKAE